MSFSYWFGFIVDSDSFARRSAARIPPRSSSGSGCDGPPNRVLLTSSSLINRVSKRSNPHVKPEELHQSKLGWGRLVAEVGSDIRETVEDSGNHRHGDDSRSRAVFDDGLCFLGFYAVLEEIQSLRSFVSSPCAEDLAGWKKPPTRHRLDIVRRMHRHHLGIYSNAIPPVRVETVGNLNQRQWWRRVRVEVTPNGVRSPVHVEGIGHGESGIPSLICREI